MQEQTHSKRSESGEQTKKEEQTTSSTKEVRRAFRTLVIATLKKDHLER